MEGTPTRATAGGAKMRRPRHAAANPQDLDDVESGKFECGSSFEGDDECAKKDDDAAVRRSARAFLSDLSPFSRRVVRFVTPSHPSLPDRCTSECLTVAALRILPSLALLMALPFLLWDGYPEWGALNLYPLVRHADMVWSSLLHTSAWPVSAGTLLAAALLPRGGGGAKCLPPKGRATAADRAKAGLSALAANRAGRRPWPSRCSSARR